MVISNDLYSMPFYIVLSQPHTFYPFNILSLLELSFVSWIVFILLQLSDIYRYNWTHNIVSAITGCVVLNLSSLYVLLVNTCFRPCHQQLKTETWEEKTKYSKTYDS